MTQLLEDAFKKISSLPEIEQNIYAKFIMKEIDSELKWEKAFSESEDVLEDMANDALKEFMNGKTEVLNIDKL